MAGQAKARDFIGKKRGRAISDLAMDISEPGNKDWSPFTDVLKED